MVYAKICRQGDYSGRSWATPNDSASPARSPLTPCSPRGARQQRVIVEDATSVRLMMSGCTSARAACVRCRRMGMILTLEVDLLRREMPPSISQMFTHGTQVTTLD